MDSILTATGNDYGYERVFTPQLEALDLSVSCRMFDITKSTLPACLGALELNRQVGITASAEARGHGCAITSYASTLT
jgi:phosphoheptose isomerase